MSPSDHPFRIQQSEFSSPLFLAPMAGISHSAFRRLVASFGGYGALFTEMVPLRPALVQDLFRATLTRRRDEEQQVIYQMVITGTESIGTAVTRLAAMRPAGIDINLGCPAPMISHKGGGKALYDDFDRLREVLDIIRSHWSGPLTVKCRLGHNTSDWQEQFLRRLELYRSVGIDGLILHPRFYDEKLKRQARWHYFGWVREHWKLPFIGNGDMVNEKALSLLDDGVCDGIMIGRAAVQKPWIFRQLSEGPCEINYCDVWERLYEFTREDFEPHRVLPRMKEFTSYFAKNFFFGHELFRKSYAASDCEVLRRCVMKFLEADPQVSL